MSEQPNLFLISVQAVHENKIQLVKEERILEKLSEEFNDLISSGRSSRELSDGMFRLAVVEVATLVLRYRSLMDQVRFFVYFKEWAWETLLRLKNGGTFMMQHIHTTHN